MAAPPPDPEGFEYRLLRDEDREEALLIKVHALEQEHYALGNNFSLRGFTGVPQDADDPKAHEKSLAEGRAKRKQEIEDELAALHPRVDAVYERAKRNGRTMMEEAQVYDRETRQRAVTEDGRPISPITGRPVTLAGKGGPPA